jgi:glycosyltransferase involved in cell wall biosynthesis
MMQNRYPKVSIIMPCWNAEAYIAQAISSCLDQDYPNVEVIVVNDGSTDGSKAIIDGFGDQIIAIHLPNGGAPKARNIGIAASGGDYIKLLDADDLLEGGCIRKQVNLAHDLGENEIGFGHFKEINESNKLMEKDLPQHIGQVVHLEWLIKGNVLTSLPLYPRAVLLGASGFDVRLKSRQEWNLHIRLHLRGYSFKRCDVCCYRQRHHASPFRISNRSPAAADEFDNLMAAVEPLKNTSDPKIRRLLALRFWSVGRWYVLKDPVWANSFFKIAKDYDTHDFIPLLPQPYGKLLTYTNPYIAEIIARILKRIS